MTSILKSMGGTFLIILATFFSSQVNAQSRQITGRVSGAEDNQPVIGATVTAKGTTVSTVTDNNGRYSITVPANVNTLVVTNMGFAAVEVSIQGKTTADVRLTSEVRSLDDVVVIGYQSIRRKDVLGSISSIGARDLKDIPINSAEEALNGRLAGVTATTAEGSPDADIRIRVRGGMSITGDNSPLYVVDGVQMENALSTLSPQDIQSIDVLKDASATAIYGARGGNGVILITTKSGRPGKPVVNYNGFVGVKYLPKKLKVLDPYDFVIYQSERSRGSEQDSTTFTENFGTTWDTLENYRNVAPIDWQDEIFGETGITTTHNLSITGGSKKLTYVFGYTYNNEKAIVINSNYKRHLFNMKADYKVTNKLKIGVSARYTSQNVLGAGVSDTKGSAYNRLRNAVKYRPFLSEGQEIDDADPIADPNVGNGLNLTNPLLLANSEFRKKTTNTLNLTANLSYQITKNLSFRSTFGYIHSERLDRQFFDTLTPYSIINGAAKPIVRLDTTINKTITNSNVLTYSVKDFRDHHDLDVLLGQETYELRSEVGAGLFRDYPSFISHGDAFKQTNIANPFTGYPRLYESRYTSISFFSRVNYSYKDKYLFSFNVRADGASKFGTGNKWGYFPAGSFAWRVKNEKFMENVNFINDLKFRAGFGAIGNNRITDYLYLTTFRTDGAYFYGINDEAIIASYSSELVNEKLKWESTTSRNFGVDVVLFNRAIDLSVDVYKNTSKDLLLRVPVASTYGYATQLQNIGKTSNRGVEVQLNASIMRRKDFSWGMNFNISFNKNRIEALGLNQEYFFADASWGVSGQPTDYIQMIGHPVGSMWGLMTDGFYTVDDFDYDDATGIYTLRDGVVDNFNIIGPVQPGSIKFKDLNGDNVIDIDDDRTIIGNPTPKFTGGLTQFFTYKNWDASVFLNFSYGNDIYNANKIEFTNGYTANSNMLHIMRDRWRVVTPDGQTAQWINNGNVYGIAPDELAALNSGARIWQPVRGAGAFYPHSWAIEDGSFLRINNVTIGYTLPSTTVSRWKMSKIRLYVTMNNLAVFTNYSGYDPEVSVRNNSLTPGLDYSAYPKSRSFIFGLNATF